MILPRRLFMTADGKFCEIDDVRQAKNFRPAGYPIQDAEAERIGLKAYLDETGWGPVAEEKPAAEEKAIPEENPAVEEKAVAQAKTEDKAVEPPSPGESHPGDPSEPEAKEEPGPGLHLNPELRRGGRRGS